MPMKDTYFPAMPAGSECFSSIPVPGMTAEKPASWPLTFWRHHSNGSPPRRYSAELLLSGHARFGAPTPRWPLWTVQTARKSAKKGFNERHSCSLLSGKAKLSLTAHLFGHFKDGRCPWELSDLTWIIWQLGHMAKSSLLEYRPTFNLVLRFPKTLKEKHWQSNRQLTFTIVLLCLIKVWKPSHLIFIESSKTTTINANSSRVAWTC